MWAKVTGNLEKIKDKVKLNQSLKDLTQCIAYFQPSGFILTKF
jgi:hypothetical protein